jgi:ABC-type antimicrobial peptide transport system permease subunit
MKHSPPAWADRFLKWYCRHDRLDEIQGDCYELYNRKVKDSKRKADLYFIWNVLRFFRWKNIRKHTQKNINDRQISIAMIKNILLVALRNFFRQPGHALLNMLGLTVGFTCAFFVLAWVMFEFSFDKFNADTDRLFKVMTHVEADGNVQTYDAASVVIDVSSIPEAEQMVSVSAGTRWPHVLCFRSEGGNKDCVYLNGVYASENLFSVFNFPVLHGDANTLKQPNTIAISQHMAGLLFNTEDAIGKTIKVDDRREVVVSAVFKNIPVNSSLRFDFAMPYTILKKQWGVNDQQFAENFFHIYLKTNAPVSAEDLTPKLNDIRVITEAYKAQKISYQALPLSDWRLKKKFENGKQSGGRMEYVILFIIIGTLVTAMAVINFINMTTARATTRAKEIGIRKVTGAFRSSIMLQFIGESFLIVLVAFLAAATITHLAIPAFREWLGEEINISLFQGSMPVFLFAFLILISLLAGLYPAFVLSSFNPVNILKGQSGQVTGSRKLRKFLLVAQLSISIGIIIFSGVLYLQLNYVTQKNLGFDRENMIRMEPTARLFRSFEAFKNEIGKHPSITHVAASASNPLHTGGGNTGVNWPGKPKDLRITFKTIGCSYEFPETFGLKVTEGRTFQSQPQDSVNSEVLISRDAAKVMGLTDPVGEIITIGQTPCVIIGVVNDFHTSSLHETRLPVILYRVGYMNTSAVYVKYKAGTTLQSLEALGKVYKQFEPDFTMKYWFQDDTFNDLYKTEILALRLIVGFTLVALIIATIGIVGLATYNTLRKTKEIGVRRVLGASVIEVLTLLFNEFSVLLIIATVIAAPVAWYAADQWLQGFAYRTSIPWWIFAITFSGVSLLIVLIVCAQGLKTVAANPTKALRSE